MVEISQTRNAIVNIFTDLFRLFVRGMGIFLSDILQMQLGKQKVALGRR